MKCNPSVAGTDTSETTIKMEEAGQKTGAWQVSVLQQQTGLYWPKRFIHFKEVSLCLQNLWKLGHILVAKVKNSNTISLNKFHMKFCLLIPNKPSQTYCVKIPFSGCIFWVQADLGFCPKLLQCSLRIPICISGIPSGTGEDEYKVVCAPSGHILVECLSINQHMQKDSQT